MHPTWGRRGWVAALAGLAAAAVTSGLAAQAPASEPAAVETVQRLFDAMEAADTALARSVLTDGARFHSVRHEEGGKVLSSVDADGFLEALAAAETPWRERMWDPDVRVHGDVAMVWTPYEFRLGESFSHCGVNIFTLAREGGAWRITGVTYTVERSGCPEPPEPQDASGPEGERGR